MMVSKTMIKQSGDSISFVSRAKMEKTGRIGDAECQSRRVGHAVSGASRGCRASRQRPSSNNWDRLVMRIVKRRPRRSSESAGRLSRPCETLANSRDPEVRTRAGALAQKIENALLTQPTRLQLNFQNSPLPEVARSLSRQTGFRIELYPANLPKWRQQRVNLNESESVDFWKAIDQLCDLAGLQYNASMHGLYRSRRAGVCLDRRRDPYRDADLGPRSVSRQLDWC